MRKSQEQAIRAHIQIPEELQLLIRGATEDLYNGPLDADRAEDLGIPNWPGFPAACKRLDNELEIPDLWVDSNDFVQDSEPEWGPIYQDEEDGPQNYPEEWTFVDASVTRRLLLGELAGYL